MATHAESPEVPDYMADDAAKLLIAGVLSRQADGASLERAIAVLEETADDMRAHPVARDWTKAAHLLRDELAGRG